MCAAEIPAEWRYTPEPLDVGLEYASSTYNQDARFYFYTFAEPRVDPEVLIRQELQLQGDETILDVGCGNAKMLVGLRENGHYGKLLGLDISDNLFLAANAATWSAGLEPIDFMVGSAEAINLPDNSVDVSSALFMLYHCDPVRALNELKRVTKPGGTIVVATSGPLNKFYHRAFEGLLAEELGYRPSPRFNVAFDTTVADELLPTIFPKIQRVEQRAYVDLTNKPENQAAREAFNISLSTMRLSMRPINQNDSSVPQHRKWEEAVARIWEAMDETTHSEPKNTLHEFIERDYYFCTNPEKSS